VWKLFLLGPISKSQGWAFAREVYRVYLAEDREIADPQRLAGLLHRISTAAEPVFERASSEEVRPQLRSESDEAALGAFGAPSFTLRSRLSWGNDRLDNALAFALAP